jgi:lysophospholipase L1-like esterase
MISKPTIAMITVVMAATVSVGQAAEGGAPAWPWAEYGIAQTTNPAGIPTQRTDWALNYHQGMLELADKESIRVLFLGDSMMNDIWKSRSLVYAERVKAGGNPVWQTYYAPLPAANFGVSGDETGHLLWRLTAGGNLTGLKPRVVVLLIGINNLIRGQSPEQTAAGIGAIVGYLKTRLPETKTLLLGVFPCWQPASNPIRAKITATNSRIRSLHDGKQVFFLDLGDRFVEADGSILKEKLQDTLHPSEKGYAIWAEAMQPYLEDLLKNGGVGAIWKPAAASPAGPQKP